MNPELREFVESLSPEERKNLSKEFIQSAYEMALMALPKAKQRRASPKCQRKTNWDARFKKP